IRFLTSAKYMIQLAASIQEDFQERPPLGRDVIAFSASTNLAMTFLAPWVTGLQQQIGEFDITVQTDISGVHDHFERLRGRLSDFLLHYGHGVELLAMDASKFESVTVGSDVLVPVCHRSFAQAGERILSEENDAPVPYYSPWHTSSIANTIAKTIAESYPYVRLDTRVESSTVGCTRAFVAQGAGVAWLPQSVIEQELAAGEFVRAGDRGFDIPLSIQIYRYLGNTKPAVLRLWEHISGRQPA
ncbi:MAG: substrate-binding domain-containing protein, partial [Pseudomonadota bacterium]